MFASLFSEPTTLLFFLLPVAAATAYVWGAWDAQKSKKLNEDYFEALNDLLLDRTDQAIEGFSKLADNKQDEVNLHLALGLLFRRRGELDRAIYVHDRLLKNPALDPEDKVRVQLALADNFYRSGIMDRAETLLEKVTSNPARLSELSLVQATKQLLYIYERGRDWSRGIELCDQLATNSGIILDKRLAHYHLELAELTNDVTEKSGLVQKAIAYKPEAPRTLFASIVNHIDHNELALAEKQAYRLAKLHPWMLPQVAKHLLPIFTNKQALIEFLNTIADDHFSPRMATLLVSLYKEIGQDQIALETLDQALAGTPSFMLLQTLLATTWADNNDQDPRFNAMIKASKTLLNTDATFQCHNCGISLNNHCWQCPGCHHWDKVYPLADLMPIPYHRPLDLDYIAEQEQDIANVS